MPHIHDKIDFTVGAFVVHNNHVLLVKHPKFNAWVLPGGHVELHEDTDEAIHREIKEETGLNIRLIGDKPHTLEPNRKALTQPRWIDRHFVTPTHEHIGMMYLAVIKDRPFFSPLPNAVLSPEHHDLQWFCTEELETLPQLTADMKWYACTAILEISSSPDATRPAYNEVL